MGILRTRFRIRHLLLATAIAVITFACSQNTPDALISIKPPPENCRIVQHQMGETCVPLNPQRIVALSPEHNLDALIALGIKPIGFTSYSIEDVKKQEGLFGASWSDVSDAQYLGSASQPSLEKILKLKPDLILDRSLSYQYKLLTTIAPTVLVPDAYETPADQVFFKENLRYIAELLGQEAKAEEVLSEYQKRIGELKNRLGNQLATKDFAVIFYAEGYIYTISNQMNSLIPAVFNDVGLRYKFLSRGGDIEPMISIEALNEYDADILFIVNLVKRQPDFYFQHPLFRSLKAVKSNRAYVVSHEAWSGIGILGANNILDDLFKYLANTP